MNLLIIGGLLVLALLAIVGAVFLSRGGGDSNASAARTARKQPVPAPVAEPAPTPTRSLSMSRPTVQLTGPATNSSSSARPATGSLSGSLVRPTAYSEQNDEEQAILNGKFHEMADEIRTLHEQAWQLQQRLAILSDMVERIERSPANHVNVDDRELSPMRPDSTPSS